MLMQPTIEKLHSMKLFGMAEAIRRQLEQPDIGQLSFEERFALLVDQQWDWRLNKALLRRLKNARFKLDASVEDIDYRHPRRLDRHSSVLYPTVIGSDSTITCWSPVRAASAKATSLAHWRTKRCVMASRRSISGRRVCSEIWPLLALTAASENSWIVLPVSMC
jgi:hypothetical protein